MARDTDFLELYEALGLAPDCSPEAFRQAYRRRVAELHPDRGDAGAADLERLQRLNATYASALDFQRRHGRLPGAPAPGFARTAPAAETSAPAPPPAAVAPPAAAAPRSGALFGALGLAVVLAAIALGAFDDAPAPAPQPPAEAHRTAVPPPAAGRRIELGTSKAVVRAVLGAPLLETENRWDYGPSWVTFRCEVVNGWYSSPLRPLGTSSSHPGESTLPPPRC
ncbi:MAG TPA: DnaJ domain-containing protein [Dokdonella sp.]|uniref:DnaJ domain-containing protein n=1 Tax=Dokdonella sp. TaxID=2291710 RepID=UPI002C4FF87C|nr:DnaJ domain-containing protein [Dokdonella sp.]HUD42417.1 DnaJ domain-containing protein [Dokdonella sp.]